MKDHTAGSCHCSQWQLHKQLRSAHLHQSQGTAAFSCQSPVGLDLYVVLALLSKHGAQNSQRQAVQASMVWGCGARKPLGAAFGPAAQGAAHVLDSEFILKGRAVCSAWRAAFGSCVHYLQLDQPMSAAASRALGRRASAAFSSTTTLHVRIYHNGQDAEIDLTGDTAVEADVLDIRAAAAAAALLRPFGKLQSLQSLLLSVQWGSECKLLPSLLSLVPQLRVLDLTASKHPSSDLLVIATHLVQLRELVLNCGSFQTLTSRAMGSRVNKLKAQFSDYGIKGYEPQHLAALARLPHLQLLEYPLPYGWKAQQKSASLAAIAGLTALKTLHIFQSWHMYHRDRVSHVTGVDCLSALTHLTHLKPDAGWTTCSTPADATAAQHWQVAFAGMQHLRLLELDPVRISDPMLQAIGALPQLQHLLLNMRDVGRGSQSSAVGAQAISHIPHVQLLFHKSFTCESHRALVQLPNIKRLCRNGCVSRVLESNQAGVSAWSHEKCMCEVCMFRPQ